MKAGFKHFGIRDNYLEILLIKVKSVIRFKDGRLFIYALKLI